MTPAAFAAQLRRLAEAIDRGDLFITPQKIQAAGDDTLVIVGMYFKSGGQYVIERINLPHKKG